MHDGPLGYPRSGYSRAARASCMNDSSNDSRQERKLTTLPAISLVAGSMLGIGIFIMPSQVASNVGGPWAFLAMWLIGGLAALFGALCLAELGAMRPRSGGDY